MRILLVMMLIFIGGCVPRAMYDGIYVKESEMKLKFEQLIGAINQVNGNHEKRIVSLEGCECRKKAETKVR